MKKLFTTLALCAGITVGAYAQHCGVYTNTTAAIPNAPTGTAGLTPVSDSLLPAVDGVYLSDTIHFENYTTFASGSVTVDSLKIDEINNLPNGLCWETNKSNNTFAGGETGSIVVSGTPSGPSGQYKLVIFIDVKTSVINEDSANAESLTGPPIGSDPLRYYVRLNCNPSDTVIPIDTVREDSLNTIFFPYTSQACTNGIRTVNNDLSNISVVPNPFNSQAKVSFSSTVEGTFDMKMINTLGQVVASQKIDIVRGDNAITQDRNGLSAGVYFMSINIGESAITRKVVIE
jgi:hypothetical protein